MFLLKTSLESQSYIYTAEVGKETFFKGHKTQIRKLLVPICKQKKYAFPDLWKF
jgi:hypothetical protein